MKSSLALIAIAIGIYSYIPYFRDTFSGKTKPHAFSWFIWFLLTAIGFVAQIKDDGGAGAWVTGFTAAVAFFIFLAALKRGEKNITISDWVCLFAAFAALGLWAVTSTPLLSVIIITVVDALGLAPTFRKAFTKPHEETMITFTLSGVKFGVSIIALTNYSVITVLYPASLVVMNFVFVAMLITRRKQLALKADHPY